MHKYVIKVSKAFAPKRRTSVSWHGIFGAKMQVPEAFAPNACTP